MSRTLLFFIACVFSIAECNAQKTVNYVKVPTNDLPALAAGDTLKVDHIPNKTKADKLKLFYKGGNEIKGEIASLGTEFSKTFSIPPDTKDLKLQFDDKPAYSISLLTGVPVVTAPVVPPGGGSGSDGTYVINDEDYLNRAIWAAIQMDAYIYQYKDTPNKIKTKEIEKILSRYISPSRLNDIYGGDFDNWYSTNPFVTNVNFFGNKGLNALYPAPDPAQLNDALSAIGGMDVTKYVQAFSDFLRDRIKQELTIAYLEKFKEALEKNKEIRELLPKTWATFKDNDIFNLPSMGATYKDAFADDLANLMPNFITYVKRYRFANMASGNKEVFIIGSAMYTFINQMAIGNHPSTAMHTIALQNPYKGDLTSTYIIAVTDMLSQNLMAKEDDRWIELQTVEKLNPDIIRIFFALLYDKYPELFNAQRLSGKLIDLANNSKLDQRFNDIYNFVVLAQNIDQRLEEFTTMKEALGNGTAAERKEAALDFFLTNSDFLVDLVKSTFSVVNPDDVYDEKYAMIISGVTDAIDIAKSVRSNNLPKATNAAISLITTVVGSEQDNKWIQSLKNILAFTNDVVAAKTSDQIKAVIENYAEPVQSYRIIRKSYFSAALSAYPGLYCGTEVNSQTKTELFSNFVYGVTAPIGLAFGSGNSNEDSASITGFFSIVDIGAALSYRSDNTTTDIPDKITLAQIFAPGFHLVYGIKKSPLALKLGYQYAPQLRNISTESVTVEDASVWRLTFGVSVDIPIYIFTSKH